MKNMNRKSLTLHLFSIYMIILFWAILYKFSTNLTLSAVYTTRSINLIPLAGSFTQSGSFCTAEFLFNIAAFVPFGIYLSATQPKLRWRHQALIFFLTSLFFETVQLIFKVGIFDVTDILTNTLGGLLGIWIFRVICQLYKKSSRQFINTVGLAGTTGVCAVLSAHVAGIIAI